MLEDHRGRITHFGGREVFVSVLATLNYGGLIERTTDRKPVMWLREDKVQEVLGAKPPTLFSIGTAGSTKPSQWFLA